MHMAAEEWKARRDAQLALHTARRGRYTCARKPIPAQTLSSSTSAAPSTHTRTHTKLKVNTSGSCGPCRSRGPAEVHNTALLRCQTCVARDWEADSTGCSSRRRDPRAQPYGLRNYYERPRPRGPRPPRARGGAGGRARAPHAHASDSRERHLHTAAMASHEHATDVHLLKQRHATNLIARAGQRRAAQGGRPPPPPAPRRGDAARRAQAAARGGAPPERDAARRREGGAAAAVARRRRAKSAAAARRAKHDGSVTLLGAQDSMLHLVQTPSHVPDDDSIDISFRNRRRATPRRR